MKINVLVLSLLVVMVGYTGAEEQPEKEKGAIRTWFANQDKLILGHISYINIIHDWKYESGATGGLPAADFQDTWHSAGIGSTVYVGDKWGFYTNATWYLPVGYSRVETGTKNSGYFENFRFGNTSITGAGWFPFQNEKAGILLGGGLHADFAYYNIYPALNDSNTTFFELGLGLGIHGYHYVSENIAVHLGMMGYVDFLQLFFGTNEYYINNYNYRYSWGIGVFLGIGWVKEAEVD